MAGKKMFLVTFWVSLLFLASYMVPTCSAKTIVFSAGPPASTWYSQAVAIGNVWTKHVPGIQIRHIPGAGGGGNAMAVNMGKADIGMVPSVTIGEALLGMPPFKGKQTNFKGLVSLFTGWFAFPVWKSSDIYKFSDLKGKRVAPGLRGYTIEGVFRKILKIEGLDYSDLAKVDYIPPSQGKDLMKDGHLDLVAKGATKFEAFLMDLSAQKPIRLLGTSDALFNALSKQIPGIYKIVIPKGIYNGVDKPVTVIGYRQGLVVRSSVPDDIVYKMVKALAEHWVSEMQPVAKLFSTVQPEELALPLGVAYHPGSLRYFKERGWIK